MYEEIINNISPRLDAKIENNDSSVIDEDAVNDLSKNLDIKNNPKAVENYHNLLKNPQPQPGKQVLNNGKSEVPKFELIDILTLGITYLIKLAKQGAKDCQKFKQDEPRIANNCMQNNIDYVQNNDKDKVKDVMKGIGLYHDINDIKQQLKQNKNDDLAKKLEEKVTKLKEMCQSNKTLDTLVNSDKPSCAVANGRFHVGVFASRINQNGEKEFFLVDQGGRKVPGSGFPSDDEMAKNGINVTQVASTNGMCMATVNAGLQEISINGLDSYLDRYAGVVKQTQRENVKYNKEFMEYENEISKTNDKKLMISDIRDGADRSSKTQVDSAVTLSKDKTINISDVKESQPCNITNNNSNIQSQNINKHDEMQI